MAVIRSERIYQDVVFVLRSPRNMLDKLFVRVRFVVAQRPHGCDGRLGWRRGRECEPVEDIVERVVESGQGGGGGNDHAPAAAAGCLERIRERDGDHRERDHHHRSRRGRGCPFGAAGPTGGVEGHPRGRGLGVAQPAPAGCPRQLGEQLDGTRHLDQQLAPFRTGTRSWPGPGRKSMGPMGPTRTAGPTGTAAPAPASRRPRPPVHPSPPSRPGNCARVTPACKPWPASAWTSSLARSSPCWARTGPARPPGSRSFAG